MDTAAGEIRLRCTLAQFDQLDPAEEVELIEGPMPDSSEFVGGGLEYGTGGTPYAAVGGDAIGGIGPTPKHPKTIREDVVPVGGTG